jgi:hypothetical protein
MAKKQGKPTDIVFLVPKEGATLTYEGKAYGEHVTLQVRRSRLGEVQGEYDVVDAVEDPYA